MIKPGVVSAVLVLALASSVGYYGVHQPTQQKRRELQDHVSLEREMQALKESILGGVEESEQFRRRLPSKPETERLLQVVGDIAQVEGIRLASIAPEDPKRLQDVARLSVSLRFLTSYHQLGRFISALENSPDFLWIETMEVSRDQATGAAQVALTVSSMWVPPFTLS